MSDKKMSVTRATAIAATNAVVKHLGFGLFVSQIDSISDYSLRWCKLAGNTQVQIGGRTNTGAWVMASNTVIYKADRNGEFPIEKVYVSIHDPAREGNTDEMLYYQVTFGDTDLNVEKMDESPHKEILSSRDYDESPDAHIAGYN
jgi:hypothetical protein